MIEISRTGSLIPGLRNYRKNYFKARKNAMRGVNTEEILTDLLYFSLIMYDPVLRGVSGELTSQSLLFFDRIVCIYILYTHIHVRRN